MLQSPKYMSPYVSFQAFLQASGKIKRPKSQSQQKRRAEVSQGAPRPASEGVGRERGRDASGEGEKGASVSDDVIDKFFEVSTSMWKAVYVHLPCKYSVIHMYMYLESLRS